jgi:formylmethanofuran dehydrogenase subunit C
MKEIQATGESCLCDFTFDFYWQHKGSRLNPEAKLKGATYRDLVEELKKGGEVRVHGDAGSRLGSSLGVDLQRLGGTGRPIEGVGCIVVDGDCGPRMGISMLRGSIYLSGRPTVPLGNVVEVETNRTGYRKYVSITEVLIRPQLVLAPNRLSKAEIVLCDSLLRETIGARSSSEKEIIVEGAAGMSAGILISAGIIRIKGDTERNTGVLMRGGRMVVRGSTGDFTGTQMQGGEIFVEENAGGFLGAKMRGGVIYAREGKPVPPAKAYPLGQEDSRRVSKALGVNPIHAMMYRKFCL